MFRPAADGKVRCVPVAYDPQSWGTFTDAACTAQVVSLSSLTGGPSCAFTPPKYVLTVDPFASCPGSLLPVHVYPVGQQLFNIGSTYSLVDGQCVPTGSFPQAPMFELGPEVDPTEFVGTTEMIEP